MRNITEDYCDFETAKLLKEKGFDEKTSHVYYYYEEDDGWTFEQLLPHEKFDKDKMIHCPTQALAMKWMREVHDLNIEICIDSLDGKITSYQVCYSLIKSIRTDNFIDICDTHEEACEAGIRYCLENLI